MEAELQEKHVYVSEDALSGHMAEKLLRIDHGESSARARPTIHKVPNSLRQGCHDAYEPELISIGPLHRHRPELKQMEHLKWVYLQDLIKRSIEINRMVGCTEAMHMAAFVNAVWAQETYLRRLYSVDIALGVGELVEVLVLDGCFLIELFIKRAIGPMGPPWGDARWNLPMLRNDLLLLENQIPFPVLVTLFEIAFPRDFPFPPTRDERASSHLGILELSLHYIARGRAEAAQFTQNRDEIQIHHLLHLNHKCQLLHFNTSRTQEPAPNITFRVYNKLICMFKKIVWGSLVTCFFFLVSLILMCKCPRHRSFRRADAPRAIPSAKNLRESGVKFKKKSDSCCLNVSFDEESGKLEIPFLSLQQSTVSYYRNLIALEQCCPDVDTHFTAYATFMDKIIDTSEDVEILVGCGIIESKLGTNDDVASLFNNICKGATLRYEDHYLADLFRRVNTYCDSDQHTWRAALVNGYFHNPWAVASVIAAVILLLLTLGATIASIWQTIYTVKSYKKQFP